MCYQRDIGTGLSSLGPGDHTLGQVRLCVYSLSTSGAGGKTCLHSNNQRLKYQALKESVFSEAHKQKHKSNTRSFHKYCHCRTMPVIYLFVLLRNSECVDTCEYLTIRYPFAHFCNTHNSISHDH